jgi:hypothetical protein
MIMSGEQHRFLMVHGKLPARLSIGQAVWLLGFNQHDFPVLVSAGLLKPLGRPPASSSKNFATTELEALRNDTRWLAKSSDNTVNYCRTKNAARKKGESSVSQFIGQVSA